MCIRIPDSFRKVPPPLPSPKLDRFWLCTMLANFSPTQSKLILNENLLNILLSLKKLIWTIMNNLKRQGSVKEYFTKPEILTLDSLYILKTVMLV